VALVFCWLELQRQVRIEGKVSKISKKESDDYFYSRPLSSQIGAIASPQSTVIEGRHVLEEIYSSVENNLHEKAPERPEHWGGFKVEPNLIEFWQGRSSRLHDRFEFVRSDYYIDKNHDIMSSSSIKNQNRLHIGFHYPRCSITRNKCKLYFDKFIEKYSEIVENIPNNYYIISNLSKIKYSDYINLYSTNDYNIISDDNINKLFMKIDSDVKINSADKVRLERFDEKTIIVR
jgi:hypothetical protein